MEGMVSIFCWRGRRRGLPLRLATRCITEYMDQPTHLAEVIELECKSVDLGQIGMGGRNLSKVSNVGSLAYVTVFLGIILKTDCCDTLVVSTDRSTDSSASVMV